MNAGRNIITSWRGILSILLGFEASGGGLSTEIYELMLAQTISYQSEPPPNFAIKASALPNYCYRPELLVLVDFEVIFEKEGLEDLGGRG